MRFNLIICIFPLTLIIVFLTYILINSKNFSYWQFKDRITFQDEYFDSKGLIDNYFNQKNILLSVSNSTDTSITTDNNLSFLTLKKFNDIFKKQHFDNDQQKLIWLHNFIKKQIPFSTSLYSNISDIFTQQSISHSLSSFGTGDCGYSTEIFYLLSSYLGYQTRTWHLTGHAVSEVFYNNTWHYFDPSSLNFFLDSNGQVADINYVINLAKNNQFSKLYNEVLSSEEDNEYNSPPIDSLYVKNNNISLSYFPKEKKIFLKSVHLFTTNRSNLSEELKHPPKYFLSNYQNKIGNIIREIPIKSLINNNNDQVTIHDSFPIVGLYLINNQPMINLLRVTPNVLSSQNNLVNGYYFELHKYFGKVIDFSFTLPNLTDNYTTSITLSNIEQVKYKYPQAKLLVVTQYSIQNTDFNNLKSISSSSGLNIN